MSTALDATARWPEEPDGSRARAPLLRRVQSHWNDLMGRRAEDDLLLVTTRSSDDSRVLILVILASLLFLAVVVALRDASPAVASLAGLVCACAAFEVACGPVERRLARPAVLRLIAAKTAFYAVAIGVFLGIAMSSDDLTLYARHPIAFLIYPILVAAAGLRGEPRLPLAAGLFSLLSYGAVCALVPRVAAASAPDTARSLLRDFDGASVIGHVVILFCATLTAVASARRGQAVRRLSVRDGLTGLLNRQIFDACLVHERERAERSGLPLSVAMLDVDHFKQLNDVHGHVFGDDVLRWIARLLRQSVRATDLVARYGGEEFVVVFVDSADDRLLERIDGLRARIAGAEIRPTPGAGPVRVTVSAGIARWPTDADDVHAALRIADDRLYLAKRAGRNRLIAAGPGDGAAAGD